MLKNRGVGAAGVFQGVGEDGQVGEATGVLMVAAEDW
jgi:hypothetical protein